MGLSYQEEFAIPFDMVDVKQEIKLPDFISYCLGVSGRQSEELGRSDLYVFQEFGLIWVVTDYELTIQCLPKYNETITIKTEAVSYNKFSVIGCFISMMRPAISCWIFFVILS